VRMPVFRRTKRRLLVLTGLLLSSILFAACSEPASILDVAGPVADSERTMFYIVIVIAAIVFIGVEGALIYSVVRFRARPDTPNPRQLHGDMRLELLWTVIPSFILLIILVFTIRGLVQVAPEAEPTDGKKVNVVAVGHQWWWEFYYKDYQFSTADSLVIPTGATIHVDLFSNNVLHSFWVPNLTGKTDVVSGHNNSRWFIADKVGTYIGICTEYCGTQHGNMRFNVVAQNPDAFQTWVHTQQYQKENVAQDATVNPEASPDKYSAAKGKAVFLNSCKTCHGIVGLKDEKGNVVVDHYPNTQKSCNTKDEQASECPIGPNLTHFGSRDLIAGGVLEHDPKGCADPASPTLYETCTLAQWLKDPGGIKPGNDMSVSLNDEQIRDLVAYLETLK
jgi:cytochrome c oxidase subunit 2